MGCEHVVQAYMMPAVLRHIPTLLYSMWRLVGVTAVCVTRCFTSPCWCHQIDEL
jgi:hypothetical protein